MAKRKRAKKSHVATFPKSVKASGFGSSPRYVGYNAVVGKPQYLKGSWKPFVPVQAVHDPLANIKPSGRGLPLGKHNGGGFGRGSLTARSAAGMPSGGAASPKRGDAATRTAVKEPEPAKSSKRRDWDKLCKKRPDSKSARGGSGGSKEFVPWC